jgi:CRISPR-associated protein Cas2
MSEPVRRLLVAYDISNDARRDRVATELQRYGERIQYSVFVVDGRPAAFVRLAAALRSLIDEEADTILLCDLGPRDGAARRAVSTIGAARTLMVDSDTLIV